MRCGGAIHPVHAKDTALDPSVQATIGLPDKGSLIDAAARGRNCVTPGHGHGEAWWRCFCHRLRMVGYDGWLSIEHEDAMLSRRDGLAKTGWRSRATVSAR